MKDYDNIMVQYWDHLENSPNPRPWMYQVGLIVMCIYRKKHYYWKEQPWAGVEPLKSFKRQGKELGSCMSALYRIPLMIPLACEGDAV